MNKKVFSNSSDLESTIKEHFETQADSYERPTVKIALDKERKICTVSLSKMYHGLGSLVSFKNLSWLSEQLGTDEIDLENEYYRSGCESCDYGSSHSVDIVCKNISL